MLPLQGLTFTTTGFTMEDQEAIRAKVLKHGGSFSVDVLSSTTHIVVAYGSTKKCLVGRQVTTIQLVTAEWLTLAVASPKLRPAHEFPTACFAQPLTGYVICITALTPEERQLVRERVQAHGGVYQGDLDTAVTHLLVPTTFNYQQSDKNAKVVFAQANDIPVVYLCWLNAMRSGFVVEEEVTDICRAVPFVDVHGDLDVSVSEKSPEDGEKPLVAPYSPAEAEKFCNQRVQEGIWGQKNEAGVRASVYEAFRAAFTSSLSNGPADVSSPLLEVKSTQSPVLAAAVAQQRQSRGEAGADPATSLIHFLNHFMQNAETADFLQSSQIWFYADPKEEVPFGTSGLAPPRDDQRASALLSNSKKSSDADVTALLKCAIAHAYGIPLPILMPNTTHIVIPLKEGKPQQLPFAAEDILRNICDSLPFPAVRIVTGMWVVESLRAREALPYERFTYTFSARESLSPLSPSFSQRSSQGRSQPRQVGAFGALGSPIQRSSQGFSAFGRQGSQLSPPIASSGNFMSQNSVSPSPVPLNQMSNFGSPRQLALSPPQPQRPAKRPRRLFQNFVFELSEDFADDRRAALKRLIVAYGGVVRDSSMNLSPTNVTQSGNQRPRLCTVVPHAYERRTFTEKSPFENRVPSPFPWSAYISQDKSPRDTATKATRRTVTSSWIFGLLRKYWEISTRANGKMSKERYMPLKKFFSKKVERRLLESAPSLGSTTNLKNMLWWWYYNPIKGASKESSAISSISVYTPSLTLKNRIDPVCSSLGIKVTSHSPKNCTHVLLKKSSPKIEALLKKSNKVPLLMVAIVQSAQTGTLSLPKAEDASPSPPLDMAATPIASPRHTIDSASAANAIFCSLSPGSYARPAHLPLLASPSSPSTPQPSPTPSPGPVAQTPQVTIDSSATQPYDNFAGEVRIAFNLSSWEGFDMHGAADTFHRLGAAVALDFQFHAEHMPTHLIASTPSPRLVILCALARGMWVLRPQYALDCQTVGKLMPPEPYEWTIEKVDRSYRLITVRHVVNAIKVWRERRQKTRRIESFGAFNKLRILLYAHDAGKRKQFARILRAGNALELKVVEEMPAGRISGFDMVLLDEAAVELLKKSGYVPAEGEKTPMYSDRWLMHYLTCKPVQKTKVVFGEKTG